MKRDVAGTVLAGKYELIQVAGQGGMAVVWRAKMRHRGRERPVAVKRMLVNDRDQEFAELFIEEARVGLQLEHPNIVKVLDFAADEQHGYYLVMEWVDGIDLLDFMRAYHADRRHIPWPAVVAVGVGVCQGLQGAHERTDSMGELHPVIHRDLTPGNVLVGVDGAVKIADFGLARATDRGSMTMPNTIKGKLSYTAPELANGESATERSDIFSLGVTLWECLAARKLFAGKSNLEVIEAIFNWSITPLAPLRPDIPLDVVEVVTRAISRSPESRFSTAKELGVALQELLRRDPVDAERLGATVRAARARLAEMDSPEAPVEDSMILEDGSAPDAHRVIPPKPPPVRRPPPPPPPRLTPSSSTRPSPKSRRPMITANRSSPPPARSPEPEPLAAKRAAPPPPAATVPKPAGALPGLGLLGALRPRPAQKQPTATPVPDTPIAKILSERPSPSIREIAPHEATHLSLSDLFEERIQADLDTAASPASTRMSRRRGMSELVEVLDHASSWDLPAPGKADDSKQ